MGVQGGYCINGQRCRRLRWDRRRRLQPSMSREEAVDIFLTQELDSVGMLCNVKSIEVVEEPKVLKRGRIFRW